MHYDLSRKSRSTTKEQIYTYTPQKENNYDNPIQTYRYKESYTQHKKYNYDNLRQDDKSYYQQKTKSEKQEKPRSIYKYKIERDESGINRYVLEEPINNPIKLINNYDIVCVYPSNGTKYYKNVNIYNYKNKLII
jgi:hypothetical protein